MQVKKSIKKFVPIPKFFLILLLITGWVFSGWPQIYNFPPKVQEVQADTTGALIAGANSAVTSSAGDNNGFETTPANADNLDNNAYAVSASTGSGNATDGCATFNQSEDDAHNYYNFGIAPPTGSTIDGIQVNTIAKWSTNTGTNQLCVELSWDGGTNWTSTAYTTGDVQTSESADALGGSANNWGRTWSVAEMNNTNFRVRVMIDPGGANTTTASLELLTVDVTYTPPVVVDTPTFTDSTGTYNNDLSETITVASPADAVICYTTNGDTPAATSPGTCSTGSTYSGAVNITVTGTTLKAIGTKAGYTNSAVQSATYTLAVASPSFGTNGGSFNNDTTSTQTSATTDAVFCQTVDGSTSPAASTPGTCSVGTTGADATVIATGKTIKALGTKANYVNSAVQTSSEFTLTVGAITNIPGAGTYTSAPQSVTLNIATTIGATAYYTTNGSAVSCASTAYSVPFDIYVTTTINAIGCKTNYVSDTAISDLYTLNLNSAPSFSGNPTDSPDPVVSGRDVTFSGIATDSADSWYLAVCKTDSVTAGSPPTCATNQLLCISSSAVGTGSPNTCTWTSSGSTAQNWFAFACDNNANPMCSSSNIVNSPVTVNAAVISVTVSPTTTSYGMMATSGVRKASTGNANNEFIVTNNSTNVEEDFEIISSDATGGAGWTLSTTGVGSSIFMHAYSTLKTLAASFTLGILGEHATKWVAMSNSVYRPLATNVAISGTVDLILELLSPSSIGGGDYGVTKNITVTIRAIQHN